EAIKALKSSGMNWNGDHNAWSVYDDDGNRLLPTRPVEVSPGLWRVLNFEGGEPHGGEIRQSAAAAWNAAYHQDMDAYLRPMTRGQYERWREFRGAEQDLYRVTGEERGVRNRLVPDAPFKTSWPMLIMKRMIRHAAENGHERIAWTTGEQQAERYNLQKHVKAVQVEKDTTRSGDYRLVVWNHDDRIVVPNGGDGFPLGGAQMLWPGIWRELGDQGVAGGGSRRG